MSHLPWKTVKLELVHSAISVVAMNSLKGCWCLMRLMTGKIGLVVFMAEEPSFVFVKDEV